MCCRFKLFAFSESAFWRWLFLFALGFIWRLTAFIDGCLAVEINCILVEYGHLFWLIIALRCLCIQLNLWDSSQLRTQFMQSSGDSYGNTFFPGMVSIDASGSFRRYVAILCSRSSQLRERPIPVAELPNITCSGKFRLVNWGSQSRRQKPAKKE